MNSDFYSEASDVLILPAQTISGTGAITGPAVDLQQFKGVVRAVMNVGVIAGTNTPTLAVSVNTSADGLTNWTSANIAFTNVSNASGNNVQVSVGIDTRSVSRFIQVVTAQTGTTPSFPVAIVGVGIKANY